MSDKQQKDDFQKQYSYAAMSSKVVTSRRRPRGADEPDGTVQALSASAGRMGDRVATARPAVKQKRQSKEEQKPPAKKKARLVVAAGETVLDVGTTTLLYQPETANARTAYEGLLGLVSSQYGWNGAVLKDAVQEIIRILRGDDGGNKEQNVKVLLREVSKDTFTKMVQLTDQLDDYHQQQHASDAMKTDEMDEEGVAVVFEDDEDQINNDDSDVDENVVVDSESSDDEDGFDPLGGKKSEETNPFLKDDDEPVDVEKQILGTDKKKSSKNDDRVLTVHEIDAHFLQRQLAPFIPDADESAQAGTKVLQILGNWDLDLRQAENRLTVLLGFELFGVIRLLLRHRVLVWATVSIKRAQSDAEREKVEQLLKDRGEQKVLDALHAKTNASDWASRWNSNKPDVPTETNPMDVSKTESGESSTEPHELNLDLIVQDLPSKACVLPDTSWRTTKKGYEEVHVPRVDRDPPDEKELVPISKLPEWTHPAFQGYKTLNRVQSKLCHVTLTSSENILLCAPTGAGKTNVACLAMLNILGQYRNPEDGTLDLTAFKIIYVAPMKALVQENVKNFGHRLKPFGVSVKELSGDSSLTRQQIADTQVIVTTPEKWDIVTRQGEGRAFTQLVKLVILDEIHLLADDRGAVLESVVARVIRQVETTAEPIRLLGLSATLPNYADVATFLRVKPEKGLFFFDHSYRPVPLEMQYLGITERSAFRRIQLQNEICYEKSVAQRKEGYQLLIFVHSRAECGKAARALRDMAKENDETSLFVRDGSGTQEILREEAELAKHADLKEVLPHGFGIHHAGMSKTDRELVEELFLARHIAVLCCTATLAWGVNLPAHAVIIRGTQIYNPSKGRWAELSPLDILQMLGRAGRPQYDEFGEGIILTQHSQLQYYLSLTNLQMPVESQLIKSLPDHLNAEIVSGTIQSIDEAMDWLSYTFLFIRMLKNPNHYDIDDKTVLTDPRLDGRRRDLAHTAATILEKSHMVRYDRVTGSLLSTPLGRVASQFYITHMSMSVYVRHMKPNMTEIELLRLFALSGEFKHVTVREEEKLELVKLAGRVPVPVKESPAEPSAKVNMLLQAYVSRLPMDGYALMADMAFIQQSAARIMRALFEIALRRNWAGLARLCLDMSNMVAYRVWRSQSPLRQFKNVPEIVCRKLERKSDLDWARYADLTPSDLRELVGVADPKMGRALHELVHQFPRVELSAQVQPITRSMLRVELTIVPAFKFDVDIHGYSQLFHVLVEEVNGETILHHEMFSLKARDSEEHVLTFSVAILDPLPPAYFIRVVSDRWLHSVGVQPISLSTMILPAKFPPPTELLDLQPLLPSALGEPAFTKMFSHKEFNPVQTQTFHELFKTNKNSLVCAASNSGKTVCAAFAIMHMLTADANGKCVYVCPTDVIVDNVYRQIVNMFGKLLPTDSMCKLTGETAPDLQRLASGKIVLASVRQWDILSRRWRQRKAVKSVTLMIFDDLHFIGGECGPALEVVISRTRYINNQLQQTDGHQGIRIVGLSAPLANARDVGDWMGVLPKSLFNFSPKARSFPLEIHFQSFEQNNYAGRLMSMAKPVFSALNNHLDGKSGLVFVPSKRQAQLTAIDIMTYAQCQMTTYLGNVGRNTDLASSSVHDPALKQVICCGVGFVYNGMRREDWETVVKLYQDGTLRVLVCPADLCWKLPCTAHAIVIMGTESFDGREGRYVDYKMVDLLHMIGRHTPSTGGKCIIMCHAPKKERLKKMIFDPLPVESHLDSFLHDPLNSEIVTKTVSSMQDAIDYLTWTFLYRRLPKNPAYYGLQGTSNAFLSEHMSEMIETVVGDLDESKCCRLTEEGDITPLNLGMIASYYYVQYRTIELIASSVTAKTKIRGIVEILSAAWEFSSLPIRYGEDKSMKILARHLVYKLPENTAYDANTKALILLQSHFSRKSISEDMKEDQNIVIKEAVNLVQAIIDVISSSGWLKPALAAMEISQMIVQGLWNKDSILKQIPHVTDEIVARCQAHEGPDPIESIFDILDLEDDVRDAMFQLPSNNMADVAVFCNNYPNVEVNYNVEDPEDVTAGDPVQVVVDLERDLDEDDETQATLGVVTAPLYPGAKKEAWWVVVGDLSTNSLLSLKRVSLGHRQKVTLEFIAPEDPGDYKLSLFCMSDSYMGCDQEYTFQLTVAAADGSSEEEE